MPGVEPIKLALANPCAGLGTLDLSKYVMEPKLDGWRMQLLIDASGVRVFSRTLKDATGKLVAVERAVSDVLPAFDGTILDGEAVFLDDDGKADFNWTARVMGSNAPVAAKKQKLSGKYLSFVAFDCPWMLGFSIMERSWQERRAVLNRIVDEIDSDFLCAIDYTEPTPEHHQRYIDQYGEGSMLKRIDAEYRSGRTNNFLKLKKVMDADVVIMGATKGKGKYTGQIGAIEYGQYKDGVLTKRGQCSGMTDRQRAIFTAQWHQDPEHFVGQVISITHNGIMQTDHGFRHPQFDRLRSPEDKMPENCTWE